MNAFLQFSRSNMQWGDHYIAGILKVIKAVFNFLAQTKGLPVGNFHKSFQVLAWQAPPQVIMTNRLQWLISDPDFRNYLKPCQQKVLDTLIIGYTLGLRYKDLIALKPANIEKTDSFSYLRLKWA